MITIPAYCIHPEREGKTCRGCEESFEPALFDGGCRLSGKGGGAGNSAPLSPRNRQTTPREFSQNSKTESDRSEKNGGLNG